MDNNSLMFLRDSIENADFIKKFRMPKEWLWNEVITESAIKLKYDSRNVNLYITMGDAFLAKNNYQNAKAAYLAAQEISPESGIIKKKLDMINSHGY